MTRKMELGCADWTLKLIYYRLKNVTKKERGEGVFSRAREMSRARAAEG